MKIGIDAISFSTSRYCIDLKTLADNRGADHNKYYVGIGQESMSVSPPDEDAVILGANAAKKVLEKIDKNTIDFVLFATETGVDHSKSGGVFIHALLGLSSRCRVLECKQACYATTGAVQMAVAMVHMNPSSKVLVVGSDIARYPAHSTGEPTQGSGAAAMVISANPRVMTLEKQSSFYTEDVMDFYRPNHFTEAVLDSKLSVLTYLKVLRLTWQDYRKKTGLGIDDFVAFCYHTPFAKMAQKAHDLMLRKYKSENEAAGAKYQDRLEKSLVYQRLVGNSYAAALYISLTSLLENETDDLSGKRIGLFSYGSGCVGEFFTGIIQPEYRSVLEKDYHTALIKNRKDLAYEEYEAFLNNEDYLQENIKIVQYDTQPFRYAGNESHKKIYQLSELSAA